MDPDDPMYEGPVQAQDSCDWCYRASTLASLADCKRLGLLTDEDPWYACGRCLAARVYRTEPPQGCDEDLPWPLLEAVADNP